MRCEGGDSQVAPEIILDHGRCGTRLQVWNSAGLLRRGARSGAAYAKAEGGQLGGALAAAFGIPPGNGNRRQLVVTGLGGDYGGGLYTAAGDAVLAYLIILLRLVRVGLQALDVEFRQWRQLGCAQAFGAQGDYTGDGFADREALRVLAPALHYAKAGGGEPVGAAVAVRFRLHLDGFGLGAQAEALAVAVEQGEGVAAAGDGDVVERGYGQLAGALREDGVGEFVDGVADAVDTALVALFIYLFYVGAGDLQRFCGDIVQAYGGVESHLDQQLFLYVDLFLVQLNFEEGLAVAGVRACAGLGDGDRNGIRYLALVVQGGDE